MARHFPDWLRAYVEFASFTEAPQRLHFWCGVSAIAGALRRRVYIDQLAFQWIPNFYIILVAPPGIVGKSTTADIAHDILREVPGIHFGPNIVTWQALLPRFLEAAEQYEVGGAFYAQSALTCTASELGNLLNPADRELVDLLVTLWDNRRNLDKITKMSGSESVVNPWINILGCVTPAWLQDNVPASVVGGGLASRIIFVYAETKEKLVALPRRAFPSNFNEVRGKLLEDLVQIAEIKGEYDISQAEPWIDQWYNALWKSYVPGEEIFGNYIARKQTHLMKLGMVIAAAHREEPIMLPEDLKVADILLSDIEIDMPKVFARMGRNETAVHAEELVRFIQKRGKISFMEAYRYSHAHFPDSRDFEGILASLLRAGLIIQRQIGTDMMLCAPDVR